jgi:hypothetical protein
VNIVKNGGRPLSCAAARTFDGIAAMVPMSSALVSRIRGLRAVADTAAIPWAE